MVAKFSSNLNSGTSRCADFKLASTQELLRQRTPSRQCTVHSGGSRGPGSHTNFLVLLNSTKRIRSGHHERRKKYRSDVQPTEVVVEESFRCQLIGLSVYAFSETECNGLLGTWQRKQTKGRITDRETLPRHRLRGVYTLWELSRTAHTLPVGREPTSCQRGAVVETPRTWPVLVQLTLR